VGVAASNIVPLILLINIGQTYVSGDESRSDPARAKRPNHKDRDIATTSTPQNKRSHRVLNSLFMPRNMFDCLFNTPRHTHKQFIKIGRLVVPENGCSSDRVHDAKMVA